MGIVTNRGKRILQSYATVFGHPLGTIAPAGTSGAPYNTPNRFGAETNGGYPSFWCHFLRQTYFVAGMNPDDGTIADLHARAAGCVVGRNAHTTAAPWWTGNFIRLDWGQIVPPSAENNTSNSCTQVLTPMLITTQTGPDYAGFTGNDRIGGWAMCLSNFAVDATEVVAIFELTSGLMAPASAGQAIQLTGQAITLAEA